MRLLLAVGTSAEQAEPAAAVLREAGPVRTVTVPTRPSRTELETALDARGTDGLVVLATDGGLNTVVQRLYRRGESDIPLAFLPLGPSTVARQLGLPSQAGRRLSYRDSRRRTSGSSTGGADHTNQPAPADAGNTDSSAGFVIPDRRTLAAAARVALSGRPVLRGLIRDDHGGVLLGEATLTPWEGRTVGMRAYVEDTPVADGLVRELSVRPEASSATPSTDPIDPSTPADRADPAEFAADPIDPADPEDREDQEDPAGGGLVVTVSAGPLRRRVRTHGRAVTTSCAPARLTIDGVAHPRPQIRRTWWYEPDLWRVVVP